MAREVRLKRGGVDAGQRDVGAEPVDEQRTQREPNPLFELIRLGEGAPVHIRRELFCR